MGVAKAWRFSLISANNLALLQDQNGNAISNSNTNKHVCWRSSATTSFQMKPISWSLVCGLMLFGLGLISLFTGHMASDLEWYSQRLVRPSLYSRLVIFLFFLLNWRVLVWNYCKGYVKFYCFLCLSMCQFWKFLLFWHYGNLCINCGNWRMGVGVRQLIYGNPSIQSTCTGAASEAVVLLVS
jgi:hypothetical protein